MIELLVRMAILTVYLATGLLGARFLRLPFGVALVFAVSVNFIIFLTARFVERQVSFSVLDLLLVSLTSFAVVAALATIVKRRN